MAASSAAQACGYHNPASASVGMLNWAYPDALHVRTAVWMAQSGGLLAGREQLPAADPLSATFRLQQMMRLRVTLARLEQMRSQLDAEQEAAPMPAFSVILIGSMLWTRFEREGASLAMRPHTTGPATDDVVVVTDEPVLAALAEGRLTPRAARERGLVRFYGIDEKVRHLTAQIDRLAFPVSERSSQVHPFNEE